jgi:hypothetical protein
MGARYLQTADTMQAPTPYTYSGYREPLLGYQGQVTT